VTVRLGVSLCISEIMPASACGVDSMIGFNSHLRLTGTLCTTLQDSRIPSPALVTICFGANDAVLPTEDKSDYHVPLEEFKQNLQLMVEHVQVSLLHDLQCRDLNLHVEISTCMDILLQEGGMPAPTFVTIFFGANDAALPDKLSASQHVPLAEYKRNLLDIVHHMNVSTACSSGV
jgi:hypothetical protein